MSAVVEVTEYEVDYEVSVEMDDGRVESARGSTFAGSLRALAAKVPIPAAERHEGLCDRCAGVNPVWYADNALWNACIRRPDGSDRWSFLCPACFMQVYRNEVGVGRGVFRVSLQPPTEQIRRA